jgi:hypothetical protein
MPPPVTPLASCWDAPLSEPEPVVDPESVPGPGFDPELSVVGDPLVDSLAVVPAPAAELLAGAGAGAA